MYSPAELHLLHRFKAASDNCEARYNGKYFLINRDNAIVPSLDDCAVLIAIIECGSLTAAAKRAGKSVQTISRLLAGMEEELGAVLVQRTTRSLKPTPAGINFSRRIGKLIDDFEFAKHEIVTDASELSGDIRITTSTLFGPLCLMPVVAQFMESHRGIRVFMNASDHFPDLTISGFDLAVRIGPLRDSTLKAQLIGNSKRVVIASPDYLAHAGWPRHPSDLKAHSCIVRAGASDGAAWRFRVGRSNRAFKVSGRFATDNAAIVNHAVLNGLGIGIAQMWQVRELIQSQRLRVILEDFEIDPLPVHLVRASHKQMPQRMRQFIEFLSPRIKANLG
jgi:DNA-binding transcriptional LysR family regulator